MWQVRGSIPLFWIQDYNQRKLKPDILLQRFDPLYDATRLHFQVRPLCVSSLSLNLRPTAEWWRSSGTCLRTTLTLPRVAGKGPPLYGIHHTDQFHILFTVQLLLRCECNHLR